MRQIGGCSRMPSRDLGVENSSLPPALRDALLTYLSCTSPDRARIIAELLVRKPGMGELLADLEADDDLRAMLEIELLNEADEEVDAPTGVPAAEARFSMTNR